MFWRFVLLQKLWDWAENELTREEMKNNCLATDNEAAIFKKQEILIALFVFANTGK
jgi:hypothetical protein